MSSKIISTSKFVDSCSNVVKCPMAKIHFEEIELCSMPAPSTLTDFSSDGEKHEKKENSIENCPSLPNSSLNKQGRKITPLVT